VAIEVVDYSPDWPRRFELVAADLRAVLARVPDVEVEHVGSTSVPGLAAKPILDIDVVVDREQVGDAVAALEAVGYEHRGDLGLEGREAFHAPDDDPVRNVYVCRRGGLQLRNHLAVRDTLRSRPDLVAAYAEMKRGLGARPEMTIEAYIEGKSAVLQRILDAAGLSAGDRQRIEELNRAL
jgi:GrpB-like predicted nucleotidyltransferase (UPF0157 family)